jgi:hypothetical protein
MPADPPEVLKVPVRRYDVNIALHDILTPLTQFASQAHVVQAGVATPEVQQHAIELAQLASQLRDVVGRLNAINPNLLAPAQPAIPSRSTGS